MIYTVLSLGFLGFAYFCDRRQTRAPMMPFYGIVGGICGGLGILLYPTVLLYLYVRLRDGFEADFISWSWDAVKLYMRFSMASVGVLLLLVCCASLCALVEKKYRSHAAVRIRAAVGLLSSAILLLSGYYYAYIIETDRIPLQEIILALAFAAALCMRWVAFVEWRTARRYHCDK